MKTFMGLTPPGHKDSINDHNVLVTLANAQRHPNVVAEFERRRSLEAREGHLDGSASKKEGDVTPDTEGGMRTSSSSYDPYTIEGLKAEINDDIAASGHDTAYDCKISTGKIRPFHPKD